MTRTFVRRGVYAIPNYPKIRKQFENTHYFQGHYHYYPSVALPSLVNWLILPVIIFSDQRLSHACPRLNKLSVNLRMAQ